MDYYGSRYEYDRAIEKEKDMQWSMFRKGFCTGVFLSFLAVIIIMIYFC